MESSLLTKRIVMPCILAIMSATFIYSYVQSIKSQLISDTENVSVVVVTEDIPADSLLTDDHLEIQMVPKQFVSSGVANTLQNAIGKVAVVALHKNEQLNSSRITDPSSLDSTYIDIPSGFRALTISPDDTQNATGLVKKGDSVDLILAQDQYADEKQGVKIIESVTVIQSSYSHAKESDEDTRPTTLTLLLDPDIAKQVAYADEFGKIRIVLRPKDEKEASPSLEQPVTIASITRPNPEVDRPKPKVIPEPLKAKLLPKPITHKASKSEIKIDVPSDDSPVVVIRGTETTSVLVD